MSVLDPRLTPARKDLAASHLEGQVEAERFVDPIEYQAIDPVLPIRRGPDRLAGMDDQLLFGDGFAVLDERDGWAWGYSRADGYVGWVEVSGLSRELHPVDRKVVALRTYAFSEPDFKSPPAALISLNAGFQSGRTEGRFVEAANLGWVVSDHCAPLDYAAADFVAVAEGFLGAPYLWGGKESLGLDCSGLVQMALVAAGIAAPRDADQQEGFLKARWGDVTGDRARERGDVVFWPGHVGIMTDSEHLLHANAHTMDTTLEPFAEAEARIRQKENPVRMIARPPAV
ncbi:NlpC/P60 family protein [Maricaulis sp.]|uniref:C40 family peptidase n=1 Tax=Maricaulis sp. TaxID=1486257 RepID=UPI0026287B29|nr:NlpC/P60 family protein [Maricaulis sp.]